MEKYIALYIFFDDFVNPEQGAQPVLSPPIPFPLAAREAVLQLVTYALVRNNEEMLICPAQQVLPHTFVV